MIAVLKPLNKQAVSGWDALIICRVLDTGELRAIEGCGSHSKAQQVVSLFIEHDVKYGRTGDYAIVPKKDIEWV